MLTKVMAGLYHYGPYTIAQRVNRNDWIVTKNGIAMVACSSLAMAEAYCETELAKPKPWLDGFSKEALQAIYDVAANAFIAASKLEDYEYAKYGNQHKVDYSFGTELFNLQMELYAALP